MTHFCEKVTKDLIGIQDVLKMTGCLKHCPLIVRSLYEINGFVIKLKLEAQEVGWI